MSHLFIESSLSFDEIARRVSSIALPGFACEHRDGLNLGGGDYFLFSQGEDEIVLVANDAEHAEVFVPDRATFRYYLYVYRGSKEVLKDIRVALGRRGIACALDDAA